MTVAHLTTDGIVTNGTYHGQNETTTLTEEDRRRVLEAISTYSLDISRGNRGNVTALDSDARSRIYDKFMVDLSYHDMALPEEYTVSLTRSEKKYVATALLATAYDNRATTVDKFHQTTATEAEGTAQKFTVEPRTPSQIVYRQTERKNTAD